MGVRSTASNVCVATQTICDESQILVRGKPLSNVINLKRPLNGKQNVWKYQNGEEKSDSDGREKDV